MNNKFDIWSEGYAATGESNTAMYHGTVYAPTFKKACDIYFKDNSFYDPKDLTFWGCSLFDNEADARRSFG